jgi:hypothetical protein
MKQSQNRISRRAFVGAVAGGSFAAGLAAAPRARGQTSTEPEFSFGVIADAQYADAPPAGTRHYRASLAKLDACVRALNAEGLALVVHLGDFIDRDFASFAKLLPVYNELQAPHYHVLGNHDYAVDYEHKGKILDTLGLKHEYYDFAVGSWRFVVLDGNDVGFIANAKDPAEYTRPDNAIDPEKFRRAQAMLDEVAQKKLPNDYPWNGAIGERQMAWLDKKLALATRAGQRVVVLCHFPVLPSPFECNLWNDVDVVRLLESHDCVMAYMNGHHHGGNYEAKAGIHYVTFEGMVETPDTTAFAIVDVYADRLQIRGHGRVPSRTLPLRG